MNATSLMILVLSVLEVHHVDEEGRRNEHNTFVQRGAWREQNGKCISICELSFTHPHRSYQLPRPRVPTSLDVAFGSCAVIRHIVNDPTIHAQRKRSLVARAAGGETEVARLKAAAVDVHALLTILIGDSEHVVAAVEIVFHQATDLLICVQNMHLRRVQAEDYASRRCSNRTLTCEGTMHLHKERAVRTAEIHIELTIRTTHLTLAAVTLFKRLRITGNAKQNVEKGNLVLINLSIIVSEENGIFTGSIVFCKHFPQVDIFHNTYTINYVMTLFLHRYIASNSPDSWAD